MLCVCVMFRGVQKVLNATGQRMVDVGTNDGHTPLHVAAVNGLRQIAQLLVETVSNKSEIVGNSMLNRHVGFYANMRSQHYSHIS